MLTCRFAKFKEIEYFKTKDTSTSGFGFKYIWFPSTNINKNYIIYPQYKTVKIKHLISCNIVEISNF